MEKVGDVFEFRQCASILKSTGENAGTLRELTLTSMTLHSHAVSKGGILTMSLIAGAVVGRCSEAQKHAFAEHQPIELPYRIRGHGDHMRTLSFSA